MALQVGNRSLPHAWLSPLTERQEGAGPGGLGAVHTQGLEQNVCLSSRGTLPGEIVEVADPAQ
jgi:hypothetical protein